MVSQRGFYPLFFLSLSKIFLPNRPSGSGNQAYYHAKTKRLTTEHPVIFKCSNDLERVRVTAGANDMSSSKSLSVSMCTSTKRGCCIASTSSCHHSVANRYKQFVDKAPIGSVSSAVSLGSEWCFHPNRFAKCQLVLVQKSCMSCHLICRKNWQDRTDRTCEKLLQSCTPLSEVRSSRWKSADGRADEATTGSKVPGTHGHHRSEGSLEEFSCRSVESRGCVFLVRKHSWGSNGIIDIIFVLFAWSFTKLNTLGLLFPRVLEPDQPGQTSSGRDHERSLVRIPTLEEFCSEMPHASTWFEGLVWPQWWLMLDCSHKMHCEVLLR